MVLYDVQDLAQAVFRRLVATVSTQGTTTTIALQGEWDLAERLSMLQTIEEVLASSPETVVLDLSGLSFIDSSGVHGIVGLQRRSEQQGFRLVIIPGARAIQRPFDVLGLTDSLPFTSGEPDNEPG